MRRGNLIRFHFVCNDTSLNVNLFMPFTIIALNRWGHSEMDGRSKYDRRKGKCERD